MKYLFVTFWVLISLSSLAQSQGPFSPVTTAIITIAGSSATWNNTTNVTTSNNSYSIVNNTLTNGDYTNYLKVTNFGFSIPLNVTITGIVVKVEKLDGGTKNKTKDYRVRIIKNGTIGTTDLSSASFWPTVDSYVTYGTTTQLWGTTWTPTDINNVNFGFAIAANRVGGGGATDLPAIDNITITVYYSEPLPIELLFFTAKYNNSVLFNWETASEINNDYFTIETSTDAIYYKSLVNINGAGNSTSLKSYSYIQKNPPIGVNYYRLKQTDFDGKNVTSEVVSVTILPLKEIKIIKIINLYGQEVDSSYEGVQILIFDNGTFEKVVRVK